MKSGTLTALPKGVPASIGRYQISRIVGEGGMGVVYEAIQDSPRRTVALKVIRSGYASPSLLRRFEHESQLLGRLQHPGIAQIFEAGTANAGRGPQPYFAMEFIRGRSLVRFAEGNRLGTRARLELMGKICDAVHYAHQRGVIHRDLKPGNILVDDLGQPKILDFGVARATDSDVAATMQTDVGQIIGTLPYMSPEQMAADPTELDTRSDVYALGVVAYELLSGQLPLNLSNKTLVEAARVVREDDPRPLSTFNRVFRGDVETIVAKALEKEKGRRYASAAEFAADIRHYLQDEPIVARPASTVYQLKKFAKRNKGLVGGAVAVFVVLVIGSIVSTTLAIQATRAKNAESTQRQRAENNLHAAMDAVDKYLTNVSESAELKAHGLETLRRQLLSTAKDFYEGFVAQKADDPKFLKELESAYFRLGNVHRDLDENDGAEKAYLGAQGVLDRLGDSVRSDKSLLLDQLGICNNLALVYRDTGRKKDAEALFKKGLALESDMHSIDDEAGSMRAAIANLYDNASVMYLAMGRHKESDEFAQKGRAIRKQIADKNPNELQQIKDLAVSDVNVGTLYASTNRAKDAEPYFVEAVDIATRLVKAHPDIAEYQNMLAASYNNLGGAYTLLGELVKAEEAHQKSLAVCQKLAAEHPAMPEYALRLASAFTNLGELGVRNEKPEPALEWLEKSVQVLNGVLEKEPRDATARYYMSYTQSWRAKAFEQLHRNEEALAAWDKAIEFDDKNDPKLRESRAASALAKGSQ